MGKKSFRRTQAKFIWRGKMSKKYYEMIAIRNFFRNGKLIIIGEIIDCDEEAKNQMLEEELMEFTKVQEILEKTNEKD